MKYNLAIFASGGGTNADAICRACFSNKINGTVKLIITDIKDSYVQERSKLLNINSIFIDPNKFPSKKIYEEEILSILKNNNIDYILLAGYMRIIGDTLLNNYPNKILNIHPSYLPKYKGKNAIKQALDNGDNKIGVSIHYVDKGVDTGKIIDQVLIDIDGISDVQIIEDIIRKEEHLLYVKVLNKLLEC